MKFLYNTSLKNVAFTLVELLIVIIIIGVLSTALAIKIANIQARARDTTRYAKMREITSALELYALDNEWSYPLAPFWITNSIDWNIWSLSWILAPYIISLPVDTKKWLSTTINGDCYQTGDYFSYYSSYTGASYSITSTNESRKWNTSICRGIVSQQNIGQYESIWIALISWYIITDKELVFWSRYGKSLNGYVWPTWTNIILTHNPSQFVTIPTNALRQKWLTYITIPNGVTRLGSYVFINDLAGAGGNKLKSVIIPKTVTQIWPYPFTYPQVFPFTWSDGRDQVWEFRNNQRIRVW